MAYHRHPIKPKPAGTRRTVPPAPGKLARARAARAEYDRLYKDAPKPWGGTPFDYVTYHQIWRDICATIPLTDAGQQIRLHIHETLRKSLSTLAYVPAPNSAPDTPDDTSADDRTPEEIEELAEYRRDEAIRKAIDEGKVIPYLDTRRRMRRRRTVDGRPPWTPGPFKAA
jgi:hypothetical protein